MITVFLIWTLIGGIVHDVDAFKDQDQCLAFLQEWEMSLNVAREKTDKLGNVAFVGCVPIETVAPQAPPEKLQGM
jgi:hypothetical protein